MDTFTDDLQVIFKSLSFTELLQVKMKDEKQRKQIQNPKQVLQALLCQPFSIWGAPVTTNYVTTTTTKNLDQISVQEIYLQLRCQHKCASAEFRGE